MATAKKIFKITVKVIHSEVESNFPAEGISIKMTRGRLDVVRPMTFHNDAISPGAQPRLKS